MHKMTNMSANTIDVNASDDPNKLQRAASNPHESIWVGASAGTGKTKVLTDRVLRLLLPRSDGRVGTPPNRILCLTFTKAAANEMALRINKTLGKWAVMAITHVDPKKSLTHTLSDLLGDPPTQDQINAAQQLFAHVIDCPGGLQIMTIHSFCQSVLGRFPLEASLQPNFDILEEGLAAQLMQRAQNDVLTRAQAPENADSMLANALNALAHDLDEQSFTNIVQDVCKERHQLADLLSLTHGVDGLYANICQYYGITPQQKPFDILTALCDDSLYDAQGLRLCAESMMEDNGKIAPVKGAAIMQWLRADLHGRIDGIGAYISTFFNGDGNMYQKSFPPTSTKKAFPQALDILTKEAQRLKDAQERIKGIKSAQMTRDVLIVGQEILERYGALKKARGVLDFDDLVIRTMALLSGTTDSMSHLDGGVAPWIMYKLDQGLDHILVDEAQDTNPEQWRIIESLSAEFFTGMGARDNEVERTSFTVGDIKQSIYSFQRAAPEEFQRMQRIFHERITQSGKVNRPVGLDISFRSTQSVLRVVDAVFDDATLNSAVGGGHVSHSAFRKGQAGLVELWPVFQSAKKEQRDFWDPPVVTRGQESGSSQLAVYIAEKIQNWLDRKEILPAYNRPICAGDIMILMRSRSAFVDQLVRELKKRSVPVSGADRMVLGEQIAVQDLLSMARFCLLPDDDLTLAEVLKSPFLGWDEDELFSLAYNRKGSLWQELCNFNRERLDTIPDRRDDMPIISDEKRNQARDYLARLMGRARYLGAYEFFAHILNLPCPADPRSGLRAVRYRLGDDALDPIEELMNAALSFGHDHIDHMQIFLDHQERADIKIKREMDEQGRQVRIMTVHGSKGLQAPIVIMPDTMEISAAKKGGRLLWPSKTNLDVPLYSPRKDDDPQHYKTIAEKSKALDEQESYRLLYVAMTRAADRLYVAGHMGTRDAKEHSWYYQVRRAMQQDDTCQEIAQGDHKILRIENPQEADPDKAKEEKIQEHKGSPLPQWALNPAPQEPFPPRPLMPSRPSDDDLAPATSPLIAGQDNRFKRGNLTHKLLQFLPDFVAGNRRDAAQAFIQKNPQGLSKVTCDSIVDEVMTVLEDKKFAAFFTKGSMAEVSVTGLMSDNRIISGQIDRLVIGKDEIWIVDYKTNRPPPKDPKDIPQIYRKQLAAYRDTIQNIYPQHKIYTALLWTDGAFCTIVE